MKSLNRRAFLASAGAFSLASFPQIAAAQTACVTSGFPPFVPTRLTVDCATRRNFAIYRQNASYMGLAGCVSMTYTKGRYGDYPAGNLFLFPWLNKSGQALGASRNWGSVMPLDLTRTTAAGPIPNWQMPLDEYFLRYRMEAPLANFIGFRVDAPFNKQDARRPWFTNVDKLADGKGIGIAWTSSNLNGPWFAANRWIPNSDDCKGSAWRKLIIDGINQASTGVCQTPSAAPVR
ncbi:MAG: hypothetical protein WDO17_10085 [Alphaproteobacteria bacterium]